MPFAYLVKCRDGSLYAGWTTDIDKRLAAHNAGKGGAYTRSRRPVELAYREEFETRREARQREADFKKMNRKEKLALIARG
jgi:putative endonuclease